MLALGLVTAMRDDGRVRAVAPAPPSLPGSIAVRPEPIAAAAPVAAIATTSATPAVATEPDAARSAARRSPRPRAPVQSASAPAAPADAADTDAVERELAFVRRMRRLLGDAPERVLVVATEAERDFGRGVFGEERAALRVFALAQLGDARTEAEAAAFLREFGDGPFAPKVARVRIGEGSAAEAQ